MLAFGTPRLSETSIIHGWPGNKVDYKVSVGFSSQDEYNGASINNAGQVSRGNALIEYKLADDSKLSFSAGRSYALDDKIQLRLDLGMGINPAGDTNDYARLAYTTGNLSIHSCFKDSVYEHYIPGHSRYVAFQDNEHDTELQDTVTIQEKHSLVWGITSETMQMKQSEITAFRYLPGHMG